jgi:hypothetical protein
MEEKVMDKYFKYEMFEIDVRNRLLDKGIIFIERLLIDTQERIYLINENVVSEDEFFHGLNSVDKCYFENHTYMSRGLDIYKKKYRNTLSLQQAISKYLSTLDEIDKYILKDVKDNMYCRSRKDGDWYVPVVPNCEWVE